MTRPRASALSGIAPTIRVAANAGLRSCRVCAQANTRCVSLPAVGFRSGRTHDGECSEGLAKTAPSSESSGAPPPSAQASC
jgi:hypothetical protein